MSVDTLRRPVGRKAWIDVTKGIAIFLVVWYHSGLYLARADMLGIPWLVKVPLELFPMPAFMVLAGVVSARTLTFRFGDLWRRRAMPMLYLYVLWSIIRFVFYLVVPGANAEVGDLPANSPLTLALILVWPSSSYWFLYALAIFTVAAWLLRRVPAWVQLVAMGALSALLTGGLIETGNVGWDRVLGLFVFYLVGIHFSGRITSGVERAPGWVLPASVGVFGAFVAGMVLLHASLVPGVALVGQLLALVVGFTFAKWLAPWRPFAFLSDWGASSLHIYLYHLYVIVPVAAIVAAIGVSVPRTVGFAIQLGLAIGAILLSLLVMKWSAKARWLYLPPQALRRRTRPKAPAAPETVAPPAPAQTSSAQTSSAQPDGGGA